MNLLDILDKLNKAINRRKNIHTQLKNINNNNSFQKNFGIVNLFAALRRTSIVVMKYFIQFKEEFSRGVLG